MYIVPSTETHFFSGDGRLFEGGRLLQILNLRRGANSKRGAYLKLGANSSIYGSSIYVFNIILGWVHDVTSADIYKR